VIVLLFELKYFSQNYYTLFEMVLECKPALSSLRKKFRYWYILICSRKKTEVAL
jgi:hypothetical protein